MPLPHVVARFNKRVTNRFSDPIAQMSRGFAVVHHTGRRSGASYSTPVNLFHLNDSVIVALTYGPTADWAQNVMSGGGVVEHRPALPGSCDSHSASSASRTSCGCPSTGSCRCRAISCGR